MTQIDKLLYTARTHTTGGRNGAAQSDDGRLDITLSSPGTSGSGTNPEQLFAAGWSACYIGALGVAAGKLKVALPADVAVDAEVDLGTNDGGYLLQARLNVQPARHRPRYRAQAGRHRPSDLPLFQGDPRQYRGRDRPRLTLCGLPLHWGGSPLVMSSRPSAKPMERSLPCTAPRSNRARRAAGAFCAWPPLRQSRRRSRCA